MKKITILNLFSIFEKKLLGALDILMQFVFPDTFGF